jgi:membrane protein DedA with SNARE-associated domain/rhodanese-related sulfurtransferase
METAIFLLERYGLLVVFINLLLTEGGLPIPAYPTLATAGAMMGASSLDATALVGTAVSASLLADIAWFWNGRRNGRKILRALCRLSLSPDSCVRQTESLFAKFGVWSLLFAKFFPGMTNITVALAGVTKTPPALFLLLDMIGAFLFVGVPIGLGWLFRDAIADVLATVADLGLIGIVALVLAMGLYLGIKWWQRQTFVRQLMMDRINIDQLIALIDGGKDPLILDVRPAEVRRQEGIIPGALPAHPADAGTALEGYSRDREVVVYCSCPNEASAAIACLHLRRAGFKKIRPLEGGTDAWVQSGRPLQVGMFGLVQ